MHDKARLIDASAQRHGCQIRRIGFHEERLRRQRGDDGAERGGIPEGDDAGKAEAESQRRQGAGEVRIADEAVQGTDRPFAGAVGVGAAAQEFDGVRVGCA